MSFAIAARLATPPEVWREIQPYKELLRFATAEAAYQWLGLNYPVKLQGVHYRSDAFHGMQPLRVIEVD